MNQYTNHISLAKDGSGNEIVIQFSQNKPVFNNNGQVSGVELELVATVVMNRDIASGLLESLKDILEEDTPTIDAVPATKPTKE